MSNCEFFLSTGIRQNSLSNIKTKEIDLENGIVYINVTKNRKPLILPLNDDVNKILVAQNEQRQIDGLNKYNIDKWFIEKVSAKDTN